MEITTFRKSMLSPVGWLVLEATSRALISVYFKNNPVPDSEIIPEILNETENQLSEYFSGKRMVFNLSLASAGTEFQKEVWDLVKTVPFGETTTYLSIARQLGSTTFTRAVGLANSKNPIPIIIPCHRIIGSNGSLTGYAGGLERKKQLILHEQIFYKKTNTLF